jgi:hypothetical protein
LAMKLSTMFISLIVFFIISNPFTIAHAYLDPGSGSMLLQLLLGGVTGVVVIVKLYWERVKSIFHRRDSPGSIPPTTD